MVKSVLLADDYVNDAYTYTISKVLENLIALEDHLKDYPCFTDCIPKHILALKMYFNEAIDLSPNENHKAFWLETKKEFLDLVDKIGDIMENGEVGNENDLIELSNNVRGLRKKIMAFVVQGGEEELGQCCTPAPAIIPLLFLTSSQEPKCVTKDEWKWEEKKPKTEAERWELLKKCGREAFLDPDNLKFPVYNKNCCLDCDGLRAAYVRARSLVSAAKRAGDENMATYYENIANKALDLAKKAGCIWPQHHH